MPLSLNVNSAADFLHEVPVKESQVFALLKQEACSFSVSLVPHDRQTVSNWLWCHIWKSYSVSPLPKEPQTNVSCLSPD